VEVVKDYMDYEQETLRQVFEARNQAASATGSDTAIPAEAALTGAISKLTRAELQGVVGHEMGHIANWDIRYMTAVGILVGLIALVADGIKKTLYYSRVGRGTGSSDNSSSGRSGGGAAVLILIAIVVLFSIIAPFAASFVCCAVSRQREYLADATSVRFNRNPQALISTLEKLAAQAEPFDGANRATQHTFIRGSFAPNLFSGSNWCSRSL
jgi:heat shock protein HtpX